MDEPGTVAFLDSTFTKHYRQYLMTFIPYGRQHISEADIEAVVNVLRSDFLTQGPTIPAFEQATSDYVGAKYGVAVNSATSALHIACLALGLGPGDRLWTSPISFVASSNCGLYCGAEVDFVDIDPVNYNLCPKALAEKLQQAKALKKLPKILVPVHLCGQSCDMKAIQELSKEYGFRIIEDASHAIGATYHSRPVGGCQYSDITVFSFHPVKIVTTGEGGMAITNNPDIAQKMAMLRTHGITRDVNEMANVPDGPWYYEQLDLGFNYRLSDIHAALGLSQLAQLDEFISRRRFIARRYNTLLANCPLQLPQEFYGCQSSYHLYVVRLQLDAINRTHLEIFEQLRSRGIGVNVHYIPIYKQPYYEKLGYNSALFPESERYYTEAISLPIYPAMTEAQQDAVVSAIKEALHR